MGETAEARPRRLTVLGALHFVFAGVALLWTAALVVGLSFASAAKSSAAGVATVSTVAVFNGAKVVLLVTGGIALLRKARWGFYATVSYGLIGVGEAVILLSTRGSLLLVSAQLLYPVVALVVITAPLCRRTLGVR